MTLRLEIFVTRYGLKSMILRFFLLPEKVQLRTRARGGVSEKKRWYPALQEAFLFRTAATEVA